MRIVTSILVLIMATGGAVLTVINFKRTPPNLRGFYGPGYISLGLLCVIGGFVVSYYSLS